MNEETQSPIDQPEETEDHEILQHEAEDKPKQINLSDIVRAIIREHPTWTYDQINATLKLKTGKTVALSTISRCRYGGLAERTKAPTTKKKNENYRRGLTPQGIAEVMASCVTVADWQRITRKLVDLSIKGDLKAVEMLTNRMLGKPKEHQVTEKHSTNTVNLNVLTHEEQAQLEYFMDKMEGKQEIEFKPAFTVTSEEEEAPVIPEDN